MSSIAHLKDKVHHRLRLRTIIYFIISFIFLAIAVFHIVVDGANILFSFIACVAGIGIGLCITRMFKISWDHGAAQVVARFDAIGGIILVLYMIFAILRTSIIEYFVHGPSVIAVTFALLSGLMYGRVIGIRGKIRSVFKEQGIIE